MNKYQNILNVEQIYWIIHLHQYKTSLGVLTIATVTDFRLVATKHTEKDVKKFTLQTQIAQYFTVAN